MITGIMKILMQLMAKRLAPALCQKSNATSESKGA